jgi:hypothetical protein
LRQVCVNMECVQEGLIVVLVRQHAAKEGTKLRACSGRGRAVRW